MCVEKVIDRKRDQVLQECAAAVRACWDHYADIELVDRSEIKDALDAVLPKTVTTIDWRESHQKRIDEDIELEKKNDRE